eukprot:XP_005634841.2 uncharacterized protein LOC102153017 [Canis lupus familiaris]
MPVGKPHFEQDTKVSPCVGKNAAAAQTQNERGGLTAGRKPKPAPKMAKRWARGPGEREESTPKKNGLRPFFKEGPKQKWRKRLALRRLGTPYDWQTKTCVLEAGSRMGRQRPTCHFNRVKLHFADLLRGRAQSESSVKAAGSHCACPLSSPIQEGGAERVLLSWFWRQLAPDGESAPSEARAAENRWLLRHSFNNSSEVRATWPICALTRPLDVI